MLAVGRCLLSVVCDWRLLYVVVSWLLVNAGVCNAVCCLLIVGFCLLFCCPLFGACCLLCVECCVLAVGRCLLFVVCD